MSMNPPRKRTTREKLTMQINRPIITPGHILGFLLGAIAITVFRIIGG